MLDRYVMPLAPFVLLALVCIAGLLIVSAQSKDIRKLKKLQKARPFLPEPNPSPHLSEKLDELNARLCDAEERASMIMAPAGFRSSLNLGKRSQVLRLSRRGEKSQRIAETLSMPRKEVELLLKIHGLLLDNSTGNAS